MLIGKPVHRPNLETVRLIKHVLMEVLELPEDAVITITQLACLEEDCLVRLCKKELFGASDGGQHVMAEAVYGAFVVAVLRHLLWQC